MRLLLPSDLPDHDLVQASCADAVLLMLQLLAHPNHRAGCLQLRASLLLVDQLSGKRHIWLECNSSI